MAENCFMRIVTGHSVEQTSKLQSGKELTVKQW